MRLNKALKLKQDILGRYYKEVIGVSPRFRAESELPIARAERRIAVGLAKLNDGFRVEIRIQRQGGAAQSMAEEFKAEHGDNVNVEVLESIEVAPISSILRLAKRKPLRMRARRPLEIGSSVGHVDGGPGTLGVLVEYEGKDAVLSNAHVLAPTDAKKRDAIFQPGQEGTPLSDNDRIGYLANQIHLRKRGANTVDAAVSILDDAIEHTRDLSP